MGYYLQLLQARFRIAATDCEAALRALQRLWQEEPPYWEDRLEELLEADSLKEAMAVCGWLVSVDETGNVVSIGCLISKRSFQEGCVFEAIARYVEAGSFIEMWGDSPVDFNDRWRWEFDGRNVRPRQIPK